MLEMSFLKTSHFWFVSFDENSAVIFIFFLCNCGCLQIFLLYSFFSFSGTHIYSISFNIILYLLDILFDFSFLYFGLDNFCWPFFKFTDFFFFFTAVSSMLINMPKEFFISDIVLLKFMAFLFDSYHIVSISVWKFPICFYI